MNELILFMPIIYCSMLLSECCGQSNYAELGARLGTGRMGIKSPSEAGSSVE